MAGATASSAGFGAYTLLGEIGAGGAATVHLARLSGPMGFTRTVAIKRLKSEIAHEQTFVNMLLDEARIGSRIRHSNVVSTLDVVVRGGEVLVVLDYVHGVSLAQLLSEVEARKASVPLGIAAAIIVGALYGIDAIHRTTDESGTRLDVIHRDVSPQNILVGVDGIARVADLGIAKARGRLQETATDTLKGKVGYLAPEQIKSETVQASDVFALSVVAWETLAGRRLFPGETRGEILANAMLARVPSLAKIRPEVPEALERAIRTGLARDPKKRHASAREMARAIEEAVPVANVDELGGWVLSLAGPTLARRDQMLAGAEAASERIETTELLTTVQVPARVVVEEDRSKPSRRWARHALLASAVAVAVALFVRGRPVARDSDTTSTATTASAVAPEPSLSVPVVAPGPTSIERLGPDAAAPVVRRVPRPRPGPRPVARTNCEVPYVIDKETGHVTYKKECLR